MQLKGCLRYHPSKGRGGERQASPRHIPSSGGSVGVDPSHCLVAEDSPHGIAAARAAGMTVVALRTAYTREEELAQADLIVDNLQQIDPSLLAGALA